MKVEQLYTGCLAEAAYYIESNGEAAIIDPLRDPQPYIDIAKENGATIKYVFETHFHADFVSGHVDLAKETGATIVYGPDAPTSYDKHTAEDGELFTVGDVQIKVLHTPGHTLESSCFLLLDEQGKEHCVFTGDTLFIGDVGRPDLAQKGADLTQEDLAGMLYDSIQEKLMPLPDSVIVYPAHGAGSACGKNMSSETFSTLGVQKNTNYALLADGREDFIAKVTDGILPPPQYFAKNAALNKAGYTAFDEVMGQGVTPLSVEDIAKADQATLLDVRDPVEFGNGFIPGSINIGLDGSFAVWVGTLIEDLAEPLIVIAPKGREEEAIHRLSRVGYDATIGYLEGGYEAWASSGKQTDSVESISPQDLTAKHAKGDAVIIDCRKPTEYEAEHVDGASSYPLDYINEHLDQLDKQETRYLHCKSGYRSMIACSILRKQGYTNLVNVSGGFDALSETDIPVTDFACPSAF